MAININNSIDTLTPTTGTLSVPSGNVGIGTSSPVDKLNISDGTVNFEFKPLGGSSIGYMGTRTNHAFGLVTNDTERMRIDTSGNVSIGSTGGDYGRSWRLVINQAQNANTYLGVINSTVGASAAASVTKITGTANSFLDWNLVDGNGTPYDIFNYGSGVNYTSWSYGSSERMRLTAAGNLGIGTSSPSDKLTVYGASSPALRVQDATSYTQMYTNGGTGVLVNAGSGSFIFNNNGSERMRIDSSGNVGIGTSSPAANLSVKASTGSTLVNLIPEQGTANTYQNGVGFNVGFDGTNWTTIGAGSNGGAYIGTNFGDGALKFFTVGSTGTSGQSISNASFATYERMRIASTGNVGIGTTSPSYLLDVNGTARATTVIATSTTLSALNGGQFGGFRNRFINGGMAIDQRNNGASQSIATGSYVYTIDRWFSSASGATVTGQRVAGSGSTQYRYQLTGAASVTGITFGQRIEQINCYDMAGQTVTLGVDLANSVLTTVNWAAYYANTANTFGTLASPTVTSIASGSFTVTSTVTRYNAQISIPAAATTGIQIIFSVGAQTSGTWTIGNAQLEVSSVATPFEQRMVTAELAMCQRYYWDPAFGQSSPVAFYATTWGTAAAAYTSNGMSFPVTMWASPTLTLRNQSYANASSVSATVTSTTNWVTTITQIGAGGGLATFNMTASAEL